MKKLLLTSFAFTGLTLLVWVLGATSCFRTTYNVVYERIDSKLHQYTIDAGQNLVTDTGLTPSSTISRDRLLLSGNVSMHTFLTDNGWSTIGNQTWAFKPAPATHHFLEQITEIRIITRNAYNSTYPAGANITAVCEFYSPDMSGQWISVSDMYNQIKKMQEDGEILQFSINARLKESPANPGSEQQFIMQVYTDKGGILSDTTVPVFIQ